MGKPLGSAYTQLAALIEHRGHNNDTDIVKARVLDGNRLRFDGGLIIEYEDCWKISKIKPEYEDPINVGDWVLLLVDQRNAAEFQAYYIGKIYPMT